MMSVAPSANRPAAAPSPLLTPSDTPAHTAYAGNLVPQSPSHWVHDSARASCKTCHTSFTFFVRRHHCRFCRDVFCDSCSDFRLLTKDPKDRNTVISVRACRQCFDQCKGRKRRAPLKEKKPAQKEPQKVPLTSTTTTNPSAPSTAPPPLPPKPSSLAPKPVEPLSTRAHYYVKRQPSNVAQTVAKTLPSPHPTAPAPPAPAAETDEDEDDASSENSDDVLIDDDDEYDYSFPIPSPAPAKPPTPSTKPPTKSDKPDKDEFERPAAAATAAPVPFTPREAEIMAIPADALASVRHGAGSTAEGTTQSQAQVQARETVPLTPREAEILAIAPDALASVRHMPVVRSEETGAQRWEDRNVERRYVVPPSPVRGVADLLNLASPSTVPQPLLNTLNAPAPAAMVETLVEGLVAGEGPKAGGMEVGLTGRPAEGESVARKPPTPGPRGVAPLAPAPDAAPAVANASAADVVNAVMESAHLTQAGGVKEGTQGTATGLSSNVHKEPSAFVFPTETAALGVQESGVEGTGEGGMRVEGMGAGGKRYVVKRRRVVRPPTVMDFILRPYVLGAFGLGMLLLYALLPLMVTIPLTFMLVAVPVVLSQLGGVKAAQAAPLSVRRDFLELAAEHEALLMGQEMLAREKEEQKVNGWGALPSPSLTREYASQTEGPVERQTMPMEATRGAALSKAAPRPRLVI